MLKLIFLLLLIPQFSFAEEIKLLTWNVYMLPKPIKNSHQKSRTQAIAHFLKNSDYDVIFLQEAFSPGFRRSLKKVIDTEYPYYARLKKKFGVYPFMGPGLVAYSKFPMTKVDHVYYDKCKGADCHASKGVQLVEITLPSGKKLQVANTHMQSGTNHFSTRRRQLDQIRELLKENKSASIPQLLVGDLNIDSSKGDDFEESLDLLNMFPVANEIVAKPEHIPAAHDEEKAPFIERIRDFFTAGFEASCIKEGKDPHPKLLDHVLYLDTDNQITFKNDEVLSPEFMVKEKSCPMSDHKPRLVTLEI